MGKLPVLCVRFLYTTKITKNMKVEQENSGIFSLYSSCPSWLLGLYLSFMYNRIN
jgi:hypothetical protein